MQQHGAGLFRGRVKRFVAIAATACLVGSGAAAAVLATANAASASGQTTVVVGTGDIAPNGPWNLEPTSNTGTYSFVSGPATPPGGTGSLALSIASGQHEWLNNYAYGACATGPSCTNPVANWAALSNVDALGFSTYVDAGSTTYPSFNIETDPSGTGSGYTTFVFIPSTGLVNDAVWQTWDAMNPSEGAWYSTTNLGVAPFNCSFLSAGCSATWSQITTAFPNAKIKYGLGPNVGTGGTFTGNVDDFTVGLSGTTTVYDFEPACTTTCYVDAVNGNDANTGNAGDPLKTIQAGVNIVSPGGTVQVAAGTYVENVTVPKNITITGAGASTIVEPAVSDPNCGGAGGSSLCAGGSNVFLVQSSNVTIDHLTVNGDNPALTSGVVAGGADIDARNGIIEDFDSGVFNNTTVNNVTVENVYLRGIYASSGGTGFSFTNNTVNNVQADPNSVAIFNFGGSGTISGNTVSNAGDAISSNWSTGTTYTNNTVTSSGSGVETDNNGGFGGAGDVLTGNHVSACTAGATGGVVSFVPYVNVTISNNTVSGCDTGLAAYASCNLGGTNSCPLGVIPTTTFTGNHVTTMSGGKGLDVTTDSLGFGDGQVKANATGNVISGPGKSLSVEETGTSTATTTATRNAVASLDNAGTSTVAATCNWWGQSTGPAAGQVIGSATTTPFLRTSTLTGACPATAPTAPRQLAALPYQDHEAQVVWVAPASNGGAPITGYVVTPYLAGVAQPSIVFNNTGTTEYVAGLQDTKSYQFTVAAKNVVGTGPASPKTPAMIAGAPGQPSVPTVAVVSGSLKVTFKAPLTDGAPITKFTVACMSTNGGAAKSATGTKSPITVTGVTVPKKYTCTVSATNSRGTGPKSNPSAPINA